MKKKNLKNLSFRKSTISNFQSRTVTGGNANTNSCQPFNCLVRTCETNENGCEVPTGGEEPIRTLFTCIRTCAFV